MEPITLGLVLAGAALLSKKKARTGRAGEPRAKSHKEDHGEAGMADSPYNELEGIPYSYGAGDPSTPWASSAKGLKGGLGLDCSGTAQMILVHDGKLARTAADRGSAALSKACDRVELGRQRRGDLVFYGNPVTHVMVCNEDARADGDSEVIGASGGRSTTNGDDPNARVKRFRSVRYRKDFNFIGRFRG